MLMTHSRCRQVTLYLLWAHDMKTILIVEGDACQRASLMRTLGREYLIAAVSRVRDAISFLEQLKIDGVVLEIAEASGEAIAVLSHVAGMRPRPRVVVLTTLDQPAKAVKAMKLGVDEYLMKPCDPKTLRTAFQRVLADRPHDAGTHGPTANSL